MDLLAQASAAVAARDAQCAQVRCGLSFHTPECWAAFWAANPDLLP